jgi:hypothetical protein
MHVERDSERRQRQYPADNISDDILSIIVNGALSIILITLTLPYSASVYATFTRR